VVQMNKDFFREYVNFIAKQIEENLKSNGADKEVVDDIYNSLSIITNFAVNLPEEVFQTFVSIITDPYHALALITLVINLQSDEWKELFINSVLHEGAKFKLEKIFDKILGDDEDEDE